MRTLLPTLNTYRDLFKGLENNSALSSLEESITELKSRCCLFSELSIMVGFAATTTAPAEDLLTPDSSSLVILEGLGLKSFTFEGFLVSKINLSKELPWSSEISYMHYWRRFSRI